MEERVWAALHYVDRVDPVDPGACAKLVFVYAKTTFASGNTLGRVFGSIKSPCGNGDTHSLGFPLTNTVFN